MGTLRGAVILGIGVVVATTGIAAVAPPASAADPTVSVSGNTITFTGTDGDDKMATGGNYEPYCGGHPYCVFFQNPYGSLSAGTGCVLDLAYQVTCKTPGPATVFINLGAGNDSYYVNPDWPGLGALASVTVDGGPGVDAHSGGGAPETLIGGDGDDKIVPDQGPNAVNVGPDTLIGGPGSDSLYYNASGSRASGVRVSLNGLADDGTSNPRDIDNVGSDFEGFAFTDGPDGVVGDDRASALFLGGGDDVIHGGGGNDSIFGDAGNDTIDGGPGSDAIWGDSRNDPTLSGNDTIVTTDGESDQVTCGPGTDTVTADSIDKILDACESITTGGGTTLSAEVAVTKPRLNANKRRKKATLALQCTGGLPCAGTIVVRTTKGKSRRIAGRKKLALGTFTLTANTTKTVKLKLRKPARKILKQTRRAGVRARLTLTNERVTTFTNLTLTR